MLNAALDQEEERLAALYALELLDTAATEDFDRICRIGVRTFGVTTALITLVDRNRQWFKAKVGFEPQETPLSQSICVYAVRTRQLFHVEDATKDLRFADNPLVTQDHGIRFYAGAPLLTKDGLAIGTFCIIDPEPRTLTIEEQSLLTDMAETVMDLIVARQLQRRRDPVTGLPNRQQFVTDLADLPKNTLDPSRTLILIDVLDIKTVYEMGRALGMGPFENLIRMTVQRLSEKRKIPAQIYHVGVARLAYLSSDTLATITQELDELIPFLRVPLYINSNPVSPTVTAGVAPFSVDADGVADAIRKSMCAVDEGIANRLPWSVYDSTVDEANRRRYALVAQLPSALRHRELFLEYQPKIVLENGVVSSVEALVRWKHPELGLVRPDEFLPLLEKTANMRLLTNWVVDEAVKQLATWGRQYQGRISINLTASDFSKDPIAPLVLETCEKYGVMPHRLEAEITEGEWLSYALAEQHIRDLMSLGVSVAIDDFGSGFSNFAYLAEFEADIIKLDKSLVADIAKNSRRRTLVGHIIALAKVLRYRVVAEGIEDQDTLQILQSLHCDEGQGYLFSRPLAGDLFLAWKKNFFLPSN
jgi:EAL domain-containing protein (putative c-di-GMP-specific phosphodiesterase class I)/GGDEF domain-containing protein